MSSATAKEYFKLLLNKHEKGGVQEQHLFLYMRTSDTATQAHARSNTHAARTRVHALTLDTFAQRLVWNKLW